MEPIRIIFFDIDGTLISRAVPRLTGALKAALTTLRQNGVKLCIASGRHMVEINELGLREDFDFDAYITLNGAYCCTGDDRLIYANEVHREDVLRSLAFLRQHRLPCTYVEADRFYINFIDETVERVQADIHTSLPPVGDPNRALTQPIYQLVPYCSRERVEELLAQMPHCTATSWHPLGFDLGDAGTSKAVGIQAVLDFYGIPREQSMAFGDGENDLPMLDYVALPVVMGGAAPSMKTPGRHVTGDVEHDGVVEAMKHFGLL